SALGVNTVAVWGSRIGQHGTVGTEVVPVAAGLDPFVCSHCSRAGEVIPLAAVLNPAGRHLTAGAEVIPFAVHELEPAIRHHLAGAAEPVPAAANLRPAGFIPGAVGFDIVPLVVILNPAAGLHFPVCTQVDIFSVFQPPAFDDACSVV